jgi:hypothetical protein
VPGTALCRSRFGAGVMPDSTWKECAARLFLLNGDCSEVARLQRIGGEDYGSTLCSLVRDRSLSFAVRCWVDAGSQGFDPG